MKNRQARLLKKLNDLTLKKTEKQLVIYDKKGPITVNLQYDVCEFGFSPGEFILPTRFHKDEGLGIVVGVADKIQNNGSGQALWVLHEFDDEINYWGDNKAQDFKKLGFIKVPLATN